MCLPCTYLCVCTCVCIYTYTPGLVLVVFIKCSLSRFYRTVPLSGPELTYLATIAGQWSSGIPLSQTPAPPDWDSRYAAALNFYVDAGESNSGPPAWVASTLATESPPQLCVISSKALPLPCTNLSLPPKYLFPPSRALIEPESTKSSTEHVGLSALSIKSSKQ